MPSQSDTMPLFNIYFLGCMFFSLFAMIWFFVMSMLYAEKILPKIVRLTVRQCVCPLMCAKTHKVTENEEIALKHFPEEMNLITEHVINLKSTERAELTDKEILDILNKFVFYLFVLFIIVLNLLCLIIFPYVIHRTSVLPDE